MSNFWPTLTVSDVEASVRFYTEKLRFSSDLSVPDANGNIMLADVELGDSLLMLQSVDPAEAEAFMAAPRKLWGNFTFLLPDSQDINAFYHDLRSRGIPIHCQIADQPWGNREFSILDPDGYELVFAKPIR